MTRGSQVPSTGFDVMREIIKGSAPYTEFGDLIQMEGTSVIRFTSDAGVRGLSRSVQYAHLLFEGARDDIISYTRDGKTSTVTCMFHYDMNLRRLEAGAAELGMKLNASLDELFIAHACLVVLNGWLNSITYNGERINTVYCRPFINDLEGSNIGLPGAGKKIVTTIAHPFLRYTTEKIGNGAGLVVVLSDKPRDVGTARLKAAANYLMTGAEKNRMDKEYPGWVGQFPPWAERYPKCNEVIFANGEGNMTEGSVDTIGIIRNNGGKYEIVTSRLEDGRLPGFTMQLIELILKESGIAFKQVSFPPDWILKDRKTEAMFVTGNAMGLGPVNFVANPTNMFSRVRGREFDSAEHPIFRFIQEQYGQLLSTNMAYPKWDMWISPGEILSPAEIRYLQKAALEMRSERGRLGGVLGGAMNRGECGEMHAKIDLMMRLNPPKLAKGAEKRLARHKKAHERLHLVYK